MFDFLLKTTRIIIKLCTSKCLRLSFEKREHTISLFSLLYIYTIYIYVCVYETKWFLKAKRIFLFKKNNNTNNNNKRLWCIMILQEGVVSTQCIVQVRVIESFFIFKREKRKKSTCIWEFQLIIMNKLLFSKKN